MTESPPMEHIIEHQKYRKEEEVRENPNNHDLHPAVEVWRNGQLIAITMVPMEGPTMEARQKFLHIMRIIIAGYAADAITLTMDATAAMISKNPMTGEPWGPGEMQEMRDQGNTDIVTECLVIHHVKRDGTFRWTNLPYEVKGKDVHWYTEDEFKDRMEKVIAAMGGEPMVDEQEVKERFQIHEAEDGQQVGGIIPEGIREAFELGTWKDRLEEENLDFQMDEEEYWAHADAATTKVLLKKFQIPVMLGLDPDSRQSGIMMDSLDEEPELKRQWWEPEETT